MIKAEQPRVGAWLRKEVFGLGVKQHRPIHETVVITVESRIIVKRSYKRGPGKSRETIQAVEGKASQKSEG